jgi:hypothetical protein
MNNLDKFFLITLTIAFTISIMISVFEQNVSGVLGWSCALMWMVAALIKD